MQQTLEPMPMTFLGDCESPKAPYAADDLNHKSLNTIPFS